VDISLVKKEDFTRSARN